MIQSPDHILSASMQSAPPMATLDAISSRLSGAAGDVDPWKIGFIVLLCIVMLVAAVLVYRHIMQIKQGSGAFVRECYRLGLTPEERDVLRLIAELAGMKHVEVIFTVDVAFGEGASALMNSHQVVSLGEQGRLYVGSLVDSLREKLGFQMSAGENTITSSKKLPLSAPVCLEQRGDSTEHEAVIAHITPTELIIRPNSPISVSSDDVWIVRYAQGGSIWEFDVMGGHVRFDGTIAFNHSESVRFINRRRFPRVEAQREAMVASFPFHADQKLAAPGFVPAQLTEIAGPGFRINSSLALDVGDRAIAMVKLLDGRIAQSVARVRRSTRGRDGKWTLVLECQGLSHSEVAVLARETNLASQSSSSGVAAPSQQVLQEA